MTPLTIINIPIRGKLHFIPLRNPNLISKEASLTMLVKTSALIINSLRSYNPPHRGQILMKYPWYFFKRQATVWHLIYNHNDQVRCAQSPVQTLLEFSYKYTIS